jgi:hypothetical protein
VECPEEFADLIRRALWGLTAARGAHRNATADGVISSLSMESNRTVSCARATKDSLEFSYASSSSRLETSGFTGMSKPAK